MAVLTDYPMADHDQCPWCKRWGHDGMDCPRTNKQRCSR